MSKKELIILGFVAGLVTLIVGVPVLRAAGLRKNTLAA